MQKKELMIFITFSLYAVCRAAYKQKCPAMHSRRCKMKTETWIFKTSACFIFHLCQIAEVKTAEPSAKIMTYLDGLLIWSINPSPTFLETENEAKICWLWRNWKLKLIRRREQGNAKGNDVEQPYAGSNTAVIFLRSILRWQKSVRAVNSNRDLLLLPLRDGMCFWSEQGSITHLADSSAPHGFWHVLIITARMLKG